MILVAPFQLRIIYDSMTLGFSPVFSNKSTCVKAEHFFTDWVCGRLMQYLFAFPKHWIISGSFLLYMQLYTEKTV